MREARLLMAGPYHRSFKDAEVKEVFEGSTSFDGWPISQMTVSET